MDHIKFLRRGSMPVYVISFSTQLKDFQVKGIENQKNFSKATANSLPFTTWTTVTARGESSETKVSTDFTTLQTTITEKEGPGGDISGTQVSTDSTTVQATITEKEGGRESSETKMSFAYTTVQATTDKEERQSSDTKLSKTDKTIEITSFQTTVKDDNEDNRGSGTALEWYHIAILVVRSSVPIFGVVFLIFAIKRLC
ncbi:unnamed protein product [Dimorphilus gyrociliatus]|uniref:Uncharacterized protein n=1 Tax=Dimorphilus gyrociliatus TaxID=2664684 RepID=A0A7I8WEA2_9ANNE|nr:unnamed protein product [Dimorphilus gyrociliatus]